MGSVLYDFTDVKKQRLVLSSRRSSTDFLWAVPNVAATKPITGTLDLRGVFSSTFQRESEIAPNMTAEFHTTITDGVFNRFTVASKILSMFSIARILQFRAPNLTKTGMPFSRIDADFQLRDNRMYTENLVLKSTSMNMSAVGT